MAHDLSITPAGLVEAMYTNKPAWMGLGQIFDLGGTTAPDSAMAARLSNLDAWTVEKRPTAWLKEDGSIGGMVKDSFAMVRSDSQRAFDGVTVGNTYLPFQNLDAFAFLDSLVMDNVMRYESAFAIQGGAIINLLARMPTVDQYAEGDFGLRYILLSAGHDGKTPIQLLPTSVRVVCANTRRLALRAGKKVTFSIKHSGQTAVELNKAREYISQFDAGFSLYRDQAQLLATRQVGPTAARTYLNTLFPATVAVKDGLIGELKQTTRTENKIKEIVDFTRNPANTLRSIDGSWWGLFNAVTMAIDHGSRFTPQGGVEGKFSSVMSGTLADVKDTAFLLACDMAGIAV